MRMLLPDHPAWDAAAGGAVVFGHPPAALILAEVRAAQDAGLAPGFAAKVVANALGIAERERAALASGEVVRGGDREGELIRVALAKLAVDQPGYPGFRRWRPPAGDARSP